MPVRLGLEVDVDGADGAAAIDALAQSLQRMADNIPNFGRWLWPEIVEVLETGLREEFEAGSWAPLSAAYARWKAENFPGRPTLQRTGSLFEALTSSSSTHARRGFGTELLFGTVGLPYASYVTVDRPLNDLGPGAEGRLLAAATRALRDLAQREGLETRE